MAHIHAKVVVYIRVVCEKLLNKHDKDHWVYIAVCCYWIFRVGLSLCRSWAYRKPNHSPAVTAVFFCLQIYVYCIAHCMIELHWSTRFLFYFFIIFSLLGRALDSEHKLEATDMSTNVKKSCCVRIGPSYNKIYSEISTVDGRNLAWVGEIRYLGVFIVRALKFKCSID